MHLQLAVQAETTNLWRHVGMKKQYETPKAEIIVFDYTESVRACSDMFMPWTCAPKDNGCNKPQDSNTNTETKSTNNPYYAPGWGQPCS